MARLILVLGLVLCAATAAAIQGKYPLSGIRSSMFGTSPPVSDPPDGGSSNWGEMVWGEDVWG